LALVIDAAKFPPPNPVNAAHTRYGHSGSPGWANSTIVPMVGISSTIAEKIAQLRPPKIAVANEYGIRRHAPTRVAVLASKNLSPAEKPYTSRGMNSSITGHSVHTEYPRCTVTTDQSRLRRAMALLPASQAARSSASQCKMRRERRPLLACREMSGFESLWGTVDPAEML
jgi:hypothetical protein